MLILTLSSHNEEDGSLEDLVGVFPDMEGIQSYITDQYDESFSKFKETKEPETKNGLTQTHLSIEYLDNGWGGRYFSIWKLKD